MTTLEELKTQYEAAEAEHRQAMRRATWLERRLYEAPTEEEYNRLSAELQAQEKTLAELGKACTLARLRYVAADFGGAEA